MKLNIGGRNIEVPDKEGRAFVLLQELRADAFQLGFKLKSDKLVPHAVVERAFALANDIHALKEQAYADMMKAVK